MSDEELERRLWAAYRLILSWPSSNEEEAQPDDSEGQSDDVIGVT